MHAAEDPEDEQTEETHEDDVEDAPVDEEIEEAEDTITIDADTDTNDVEDEELEVDTDTNVAEEEEMKIDAEVAEDTIDEADVEVQTPYSEMDAAQQAEMDAAKQAKFAENAEAVVPAADEVVSDHPSYSSAEMAEMDAAKKAKFEEKQAAFREEATGEELEEAQEPEDMDDDAEAVQPLMALPKEFGGLKEQDATLKWWAVLIIVVGSVLLVAGAVLVAVFKCNAEYQMVRDKALSCCGFGHRYEPVKTSEEEERL